MPKLNITVEQFVADVLGMTEKEDDPFVRLRAEHLAKVVGVLKSTAELKIMLMAVGQALKEDANMLEYESISVVEGVVRSLYEMRSKEIDMDPEVIIKDHITPILGHYPMQGEELRQAYRLANATAVTSTGPEFAEFIERIHDRVATEFAGDILDEAYVSAAEEVAQEILAERGE